MDYTFHSGSPTTASLAFSAPVEVNEVVDKETVGDSDPLSGNPYMMGFSKNGMVERHLEVESIT